MVEAHELDAFIVPREITVRREPEHRLPVLVHDDENFIARALDLPASLGESPFSAVRLRTDASRRCKRAESAKAIIWKMLRVAEQTWRKLNAPDLLPLVAA